MALFTIVLRQLDNPDLAEVFVDFDGCGLDHREVFQYRMSESVKTYSRSRESRRVMATSELYGNIVFETKKEG